MTRRQEHAAYLYAQTEGHDGCTGSALVQIIEDLMSGGDTDVTPRQVRAEIRRVTEEYAIEIANEALS